MSRATHSLRIQEIAQHIEKNAPLSASEDWDNNGLLVGEPDWKTSGAVVCVDLTEKAIELAKRKGYKLIINHHPCLFPGGSKGRGVQKISKASASEAQKLALKAYAEGIAVIACHTNFDQCALEVIEKISKGLKLEPRGRLLDPGSFSGKGPHSLLKLVVFVPLTHAERVREALCAAGAGFIGEYDQCVFMTKGEGTFRGRAGTKPFIGLPGQLERVKELRLETVFPRSLKRGVLQALRRAHPYEEIAYDLYAVEQSPAKGGQGLSVGLVKGLGYGFWGEFPQSKSFPELLKNVKELWNIRGALLTEAQIPKSGRAPQKVRRVAFAAGKGSSFLDAAISVDCDLFITGEVGYHPALDAARKGMAVLELGHRHSERFFAITMKEWLSALDVPVVVLDEMTQRIWA